MVSIRNPVAHGAAPDGLTIAALGLMDNLGLQLAISGPLSDRGRGGRESFPTPIVSLCDYVSKFGKHDNPMTAV